MRLSVIKNTMPDIKNTMPDIGFVPLAPGKTQGLPPPSARALPGLQARIR